MSQSQFMWQTMEIQNDNLNQAANQEMKLQNLFANILIDFNGGKRQQQSDIYRKCSRQLG